MSESKRNTILLTLAFIIGLSLLLYPTFSDYWNSTRQSRAIATYAEEVSGMDPAVKERMWKEAEDFNQVLARRSNFFTLPDELVPRYDDILNTTGTGIMGYIDIPAINVLLPIYHGTSDSVLQVAIGHLEWSSLPVGGDSTHMVISGHRGLPRAKLFTDLDKMVNGDIFMLQVLDETLTYEVDQVLIVEPEDVAALTVIPYQDLCTLVTCTPYGVNTHRLLVRGHRIENLESAKTVRIISEAMQIEPLVVAPILAIPMVLLFLVWVMLDDIRLNMKRRKKKQE